MKQTILILTALLLALSATLAHAQKEKKEKKPYAFVMPAKLSGIKDMDAYLLKCDTMYNRITTYREKISFFRIDTSYTTGPDGAKYAVLKVVDQDGNKKNISATIMQYVDMTMQGSLLTLDMALLTTMTASATLSLTSNPLAAISYAKYAKDGPQIVALGGREIGTIAGSLKKQIADLKSIKANAVDVGDIKSTDQVVLNPLAGEEIPDGSEEIALDDIDFGSNEGAVELVDTIEVKA